MLLSLATGLYYSKRTTSLKEYAIGHKKFTTATLVATTLATTWGGGQLVRDVEQVYDRGLYWMIFSCLSFADVLIIIPLSLRMGSFMQHFSMPESIGSVYGKYPRLITALAGIASAIAIIASQINVMSLAINRCIGTGHSAYTECITVAATLILILYSTFGGIRAVTFTDVLQFLTFSAIIPLFTWFMFRQTGKSIGEIVAFLQNYPKFQLSYAFHFDHNLLIMLSMVLGIVSSIDPTTMQRVYMASDPRQANKTFFYSGIFSFIIIGCVIAASLFVFVSMPKLAIIEVWPYIMNHLPSIFKGCVCISLLAMTMSTADSKLNTCSVMVSHDIVESIKTMKFPYFSSLRFRARLLKRLIRLVDGINPIQLARLTSMIIGLFAMVLAFYCKDLLTLLMLALALYVPIVTAPFVLALFGFRGSSQTALIGMITGIVAILAWNRWIKPITGMDGSFFCMLANGLAMLAAHYLLPQPAGTGWVPPDKTYQQWQQEKERIARRNKQERAIFFTKENLAKLKPKAITTVFVGVYLIITSLVSSCYYNGQTKAVWVSIPFCMLGVAYIGYVAFFANKIPDWAIGKYGFISVLVGFPLHLLFSCFLCQTLLVPFLLFFTHGTVLLWTLPLYWSLRVLAITAGGMLVAICYCKATVVCPSLTLLLSILGFGLLLLMISVWAKNSIVQKESRNLYFLQKQATQEAYELKKLAYSEELPIASSQSTLAQEGTILEKAIQNVTQSIAFVDSTTPFLKEDFQSILDKFAEWAYYLKQRAKRQDQLLLQPTVIPLEALIDAGEVAYQKEKGYLPGLWVEEADIMPATMLGDRAQLVQLLCMAFSYVREASASRFSPITLQLQSTQLRYKKREPLEEKESPDCITFPALALVVHTENKQIPLPILQTIYDVEGPAVTQPVVSALSPQKVNLHKEKLASIVYAHYGLLLWPHAEQLVCLLPLDVTQVREEMLALSLPREAGTQEEASITPHEKTASLAQLSAFHDWVRSFKNIDPFLIAEILLLLRRCYGFKRHASGQLFYVRAVKIAEWVATWTDGYAKLVYATLLYDLVRYTRLPLSYIKGNYKRGIYCFVENTIAIDSRKRLEESLLAIANRFKESLQKEHISVLYVKLAERLYDLKHASGYKDPAIIQAMAKESLTIDVELAQRCREPGMAILLKQAAEEVLLINKQ
ncbi:sodium:solute symporter family transporter [Candidatus Cardinium hertigii]|uniref:sodium:solute symporter family transporter n=1 Tax=Candidatus Cardinium hertigii TaxID=247481 RepID=UPI0013A540E4|nr:HD domain-containing protein [Candidatus Cardinium hertigii]